jgi:NAD(P)-dependent dehydrogenase (short-subunit alcohol dehydrogenase family)
MKAALARATEGMALELAPYGIRVNAVAPGLTILEEPKGERKAFVELVQKSIPMRRVGYVQDVARAVVWLASDQADYVTGITLRVDGGLNLPMMQALLEGRQTFI